MAGTVNMYVHFYAVVTNDIGFFHWQAIRELNELRFNPAGFFYDWLFNWGDIRNGFNFSSPKCNVFWKDLGILVHTKYMTFANILSLGNQYVNVIIYNVPFFIGQLFLYKTCYQLQPEKKWLYVFVIFLIPSVLFWCSGIHKDGWVLAAFGAIVYSMNGYLHHRTYKYLLGLVVSLFFLFIVRYFYMITLLPVLLLWAFTYSRKNKLRYFAIALLLTSLVFFNIHRVIPALNPMKMIQSRQHEFFGYIGYSDMKTPKLENHFNSYLQNLPSALNHVFLQPVIISDAPLKYQISFLDNLLILLLMGVLMFHFKRKNTSEGLFIALFLYAISIYIFIGYTIPNCGALVRYKSEFTVLLLVSLVGLSEWNAVNHYLNKKLSGTK